MKTTTTPPLALHRQLPGVIPSEVWHATRIPYCDEPGPVTCDCCGEKFELAQSSQFEDICEDCDIELYRK